MPETSSHARPARVRPLPALDISAIANAGKADKRLYLLLFLGQSGACLTPTGQGPLYPGLLQAYQGRALDPDLGSLVEARVRRDSHGP